MSKFFLAILSALTIGLLTNQSTAVKEQEPLINITRNYHDALTNFELQIDSLVAIANSDNQDNSKVLSIREELKKTRLAFKETEMLFNYFDPYGIGKQINGAPLSKIEPKVSEINVLEPKGLQILDELIFSEDAFNEMDKIILLCHSLKQAFSQMKKHQLTIIINHRQVFEASREELNRLFTLGLTGFDTPGSQHAIAEAIVSLKSVQFAMEQYYPLIEDKGNRAISFNLYGLFEIGKEMLEKAENFNSFDRFSFLNKVVNPLYQQIRKAHLDLGIETIDETPLKQSAINYEAENLFDQNYLNPNFYSNLNLNEQTLAKRAALGKLLFFDPVLSKDNKMSCASCHDPARAFTDGLEKSISNNGEKKLKRNAPTLINAVYAEKYFYDLRESTFERQVKHVVLDHDEFDTDFKQIALKLKGSKTYTDLFKAAFEEDKKYELSSWSISNAISAYVSSLNSFNSTFDQYMRYEIPSIDPAVKKGFNLFMGKAGCGTCHFAPTFSGLIPPLYEESESEVLGVPESLEDQSIIDSDKGRYSNKLPTDVADIFLHSFKTTTVRNVELTGPYMHNGIFQNLEEVLDFYNAGGGAGRGMELKNQTLPESPLNLTAMEQADIITFMKSLTDNPFKDDIPESLPAFENNNALNNRY